MILSAEGWILLERGIRSFLFDVCLPKNFNYVLARKNEG